MAALPGLKTFSRSTLRALAGFGQHKYTAHSRISLWGEETLFFAFSFS
jgi:hypothetical protein